MQLALKFLDPSSVLPRVRDTGAARLPQAADRIALPAVQIGSIQTLLSAPGAAGCLIHDGRGDHRLQSSRRRPTLAARARLPARSRGQRLGPPPLQRLHADAFVHLVRDVELAVAVDVAGAVELDGGVRIRGRRQCALLLDVYIELAGAAG